MFRECMRKICVVPILFFCFMLFITADNLFGTLKIRTGNFGVVDDRTAFFFDRLLSGDGDMFLNVVLIAAAVLSAVILFSFQWSKKQCNVIYSFGMSRSEIFNSRVLGGLVPMAGAIICAGVFEILANIAAGETLNGHFWIMVVYTLLTWFTVYALAFILCAVVFSNTGNAVEGLVFTAIFSVFTMVLFSFFTQTRILYTLGANYHDFLGKWNWNEPFLMFDIENLRGGMWFEKMNYFSDPPGYTLNIFDFSGIIMGVIYGAVLYALGSFTAKKRKNENAGTWGKSKLVSELAAAAVGFYAVTFVMFFANESLTVTNGNGTFGLYVLFCVILLAVMLVFRLIFSAKRKDAMKTTLKHYPVYAGAMGAVILVFSLGLFGYSSYIPKTSEIKSVSLHSDLYKSSDFMIEGESIYGLKRMNEVNTVYYFDSKNGVNFSDADEINKIVNLHKAVIKDGKIKNNSPKSCNAALLIEYKLKNGKSVYRQYTETTQETVKQMMALNDYKTVKDKLIKVLNSTSDNGEEFIRSFISSRLGQEIRVDYNTDTVYNKNGQIIGRLDRFYDMDVPIVLFMNNDGEMEFEISGYADSLNIAETTLAHIDQSECYLFPKDMTKGYNIGTIDDELSKALKADIVNQSAAQFYMHKPEDEIGILSFGVSYTESRETYYGTGVAEVSTTMVEYYGDDGEIVYPNGKTEVTIGVEKGEYAENTSWNIFSNDIKAIVLTKDMVNTVKYLESHNMMQYFKPSRKMSDIQSVKLATKGEVYGKTRISSVSPVFCAAYWDWGTVGLYNDWGRENEHLFRKVNNEITDKGRIEKLLDGSLVFGFCDEDSRIMEISYTDGSIATVLVPEDVYKSVMG